MQTGNTQTTPKPQAYQGPLNQTLNLKVSTKLYNELVHSHEMQQGTDMDFTFPDYIRSILIASQAQETKEKILVQVINDLVEEVSRNHKIDGNYYWEFVNKAYQYYLDGNQ